MNSRLKTLPVLLATLTCAALFAPQNAVPQTRTVQDDEWCESGQSDRDRYCEVREATLRADRDVIAVDASPNGGIHIESWDRNEILVRAKVQSQADSEPEAREIAQDIEVETSGRTIKASGPRTGRGEGWSVSFRVYVPRRSNLDLKSTNGGISIENVSGVIEFRTTNGGIHLTDLSGDVRGTTTNGGVSVDLAGNRWEGEGLDVKTTNGGVKVTIPSDYNARLETGTVNGGMEIDFPVMVQGRINRKIEATLGDGGKMIRVLTTNGGVKIQRG
jgi:DUF4097 and DUF4098 domain-containing protein YvlB